MTDAPPGPDIDAETQRQKTALLYRTSGIAQSVTVINATLFAYVNASLQAMPRRAFTWWCFAIAIATGRYLLARSFRAARPDAAADGLWRRRYVMATTLMAANWGAGGVLFMWNAPDGARLFSGLVLSGMVAGSVPLLASVPAAFQLFVVLLAIPMSTLVLLQADSALHWSFGSRGLIFLAATLASGRYLHQTLDDAIRLRLEAGRLVADLERAARAAEVALAERETLAASQRLLTAAMEQSSSAIMVTDVGGNITYVNAAFSQTTGFSAAEVLGQNPRFLKSGETPPAVYRDLWAALAAGHSWRGELYNKKKSGELYWEYASISPVVDAKGHTSHYLAVKDDITLRKQAEAEVARLATTDPLTGVANRRRFLQQVGVELDRLKRTGEPASLLLVDIDHFKSVNDTHGHATGDAVLHHLAQLSRLRLRKVDLFGRLGGEEFGILLPATNRAAAVHVAEEFRRQVADSPARTMKAAIPVTISIGVTELGANDGDPDEVLARADAALYRAKDAGRNRVETA